MKTPACFIAFVFTLAACVLAFSAESGAPPAPPSDPPKGGAAEPPRAPAPEQPAAGDPAKDDKANPPKKDEKKPQKKGPGIIVSPGGKMSPVDIALFSIAQIYLQKDDVKSALAALERTAANSPDRDSRGAAYFSMANIYLHRLNDPDKAKLAKERAAEMAAAIISTYDHEDLARRERVRPDPAYHLQGRDA